MARSGAAFALDLICAWAVLSAFGAPWTGLVVGTFAAAAIAIGLGRADRPRAPGVRVLAVAFSTGAGCVVLAAVGGDPWLPWIVWTAAASFLRAAAGWMGRRTAAPALIVGTGPDSRRLARDLRRMTRPPFRVLGFWDPAASPGRLQGLPVLGSLASPDGRLALLDTSRRARPLPQGLPVFHPRRRFLDAEGVWVWEEAEAEGFPLSPEGPADGLSGTVKRLFDTLVTLAALPAASLVVAGAAACLWLRDGRPIFYRQVRWTHRRKPFHILKLRSMPVNAEAEGQPVWPSAQDPRISPFGATLRRLWLDEVPQLWNVLRGDLSLVGPRPERPAFAQVFLDGLSMYHMRYAARAGITGWAQVQGYVGNTSLRKRLFCDLQYIDRWSPGLDLRILARTLCQMVRRPRRRRFDYVPERGVPIP